MSDSEASLARETAEVAGIGDTRAARRYFAKFDAGTSGLRHTLMLSGRVSPADVKTQSTRPGAYGKPYTGQVVFQECRRSSGGSGLICCFVDKGTQIQLSEDGRTPRAVFDYLKGLPPGTPVTVDGDLDEVFGAAATMVLRDVRLRPATPFDEILKLLQGRWVSAQDPADRFLVMGAERHNTYAGVEMSKDYISVQSNCGGRENDGPYLYAWDSDGGSGLCYVIEQITGETLALTYLPRGTRMEYRRLE